MGQQVIKLTPINLDIEEVYKPIEETRPIEYHDSYVQPPKRPLPVRMTPEPNPNRNFWKMYAIILTILVILGVSAFLYLVKEGKLTPSFNIDNKINNTYEFKPNTTNHITSNTDNKFTNNFDVNLNLEEDLINKICANYTH
jgi:hypothetical protein